MRAFQNLPDLFGCGHYRARLPQLYCKDRLAAKGVEMDLSMSFDPNAGYKHIRISRVVQDSFIDVLESQKAAGARIYVDIDDDIFAIPEWSPIHGEYLQYHDSLRRKLALADRITVTNECLRQALGHPEKTDVLPNLVNLADWRAIHPDRDDSTVRILWAGSGTHTKDIDRLTEAVEHFKSDQSVQIIFVGILPRAFAEPLSEDITFLPGVPLFSYSKLMQLIRPHIALLPLVDCPFNRSKSPIKFFEMTLSGAACVCDPVGPYADLAAKGLALATQGDDWIRPIRELINDSELRGQLWRNSISEVEARWTWQSPTAELWHAWYAENFLGE